MHTHRQTLCDVRHWLFSASLRVAHQAIHWSRDADLNEPICQPDTHPTAPIINHIAQPPAGKARGSQLMMVTHQPIPLRNLMVTRQTHRHLSGTNRLGTIALLIADERIYTKSDRKKPPLPAN